MSCTSLTMEVFRRLFNNVKVVEFVSENVRRLKEHYTNLSTLLNFHHIPFLPAQAGFFVLLDLRHSFPSCFFLPLFLNSFFPSSLLLFFLSSFLCSFYSLAIDHSLQKSMAAHGKERQNCGKTWQKKESF